MTAEAAASEVRGGVGWDFADVEGVGEVWPEDFAGVFGADPKHCDPVEAHEDAHGEEHGD